MAAALRVTSAQRDADVARVATAARPSRRRAARDGARQRRERRPRAQGRGQLPRPRSPASRPRRCSSRSTVAGVCAAAGSSCSSGATGAVATCSRRWASRARTPRASVRLSLGFASTDADVDHALEVIPTAVARLRGRGVAARACTTAPMRVLVAMSGGVDSSVAAALLLDAGHDVTGVTLKLWGGDSDSGCCSVCDVEDARRVAAQLDIPHYVFNFADDFDAHVVDPYVEAYAAGAHRTRVSSATARSSSVACSTAGRGAGVRRRGHRPPRAGRRRRPTARPRCCAGPTRRRTSPTCSTCSAAQLARMLLPVGELTKAEVRAHAARLGSAHCDEAREHGRVLHHARRSRGVPRRRGTELRSGPVVDTDGATVGEHGGVALVTVGQRRGLGVAAGNGVTSSTSTPRPTPSPSVRATSCCATAWSCATWASCTSIPATGPSRCR